MRKIIAALQVSVDGFIEEVRGQQVNKLDRNLNFIATKDTSSVDTFEVVKKFFLLFF